MRHLLLVVLIGALFPLCLYAADAATGGTTGPQKAPTCSEKTGSTVTTAKDAKTAIEQSDKTSHDIVIVSPDGKVQVTSMCNPQCIQGMIKNQDGTPSQKPCPPGQVTMNLPTGASVTCSKAQDACGKASESLKNSPEMLDALAKGDSTKAAQLAADAFRQVPEIQTGLQKAAQDILNSSFAEGLPSSLQGVAKDMQKGLSDSLKAIAAGDFQKLEEIGKSLSQNPAIQEFVKNPQNFINQLMASAPPEMREALGQIAPVLCGFVGDASCLQAVQSTFGGVPTVSSAAALGQVPVGAGPDGKIDPVHFAARVAEKIAQSSLNGQAPASLRQFGITTGDPKEWARFFTMITNQESNLRVAPVNPDGSLARFDSTPPGERSFGPGQFNIGEYGLQTWADVNNPDRVIDAYIRVAESGNLFRYFGSLQRSNETLRHASWYNNTVAPYINGGVTYGGPINVGGSNFEQSIAGFVTGNKFGGSSGVSPFSMGGGSGVVSLLSGFLGGGSSSGGIGSIISGVTRLLGFGGGSSGGSSGGAVSASGSPATPTAPTAPVIPTQPGSSSATVVQPVIQISASPLGNTSYTVAWAALGVSATPPCQLLHGATVLASGNSGAYTGVRNDNAALTLTLLCTPSDNRAAAASARRTVVISAQQ